MEYLLLALLVLNLLVSMTSVVLLSRKHGKSKRAAKRTEVANLAVAYAESMGGSNDEKLTHAIQAAQRIDASDNGRRDFSDAELRIEIEAAVVRQNAR